MNCADEIKNEYKCMDEIKVTVSYCPKIKMMQNEVEEPK